MQRRPRVQGREEAHRVERRQKLLEPRVRNLALRDTGTEGETNTRRNSQLRLWCDTVVDSVLFEYTTL